MSVAVCGSCDGWGHRRGVLFAGAVHRRCLGCDGRGWVDADEVLAEMVREREEDRRDGD